MRYFFYGLILLLFFSAVLKGDKKLRIDEYCKESLLKQFIFNSCTPRKKFINEKDQINI